MKIKPLIWKIILDPIIHLIDNRIQHYQSLKPTTHDGSMWDSFIDLGESTVFYNHSSVTQLGEGKRIAIGDYSCIRGEITVYESGRLSIGHHSFLGPGSRIWCKQNIQIGSHVLISHLVDIHDTDSHSTDWREREEESYELFQNKHSVDNPDIGTGNIVIEDNVWIGFKASILKGVTIGQGAIVAAGSIVTKDVKPFTLVAGSPAKPIRDLPR